MMNYTFAIEMPVKAASGLTQSVQVQKFIYETEEAARSAYDAVGSAISRHADYKNDAPKVIEIIDALGRLTVEVGNIVSVRLIDIAVMNSASRQSMAEQGRNDAAYEHAKIATTATAA